VHGIESSLDLLKRVQAGDTAALDALIARYRPRLVRWASGRLPGYARDLAETQDLVQETLVQAFRKIERIEIRGEGALQAYLRTVLLNAIRMELRRVRRKPPGSELESGLEGDDASPLESYERALANLRESDRELVVAHVEFGFTNQELADAFDKPSANAARMALQRALLALAQHMKGSDTG
jgi:RNA polymerase sigma factor (sigma-70 family)